MPAPPPATAIITKSTPVSIGLMLVILAAMAWQMTITVTVQTELKALATIQMDIREILVRLSRNDGGDQRRDAEIAANRERIGRLENQIETLKGKKP